MPTPFIDCGSRRCRPAAFTLVELLAVLAIIGVLSAIVISSLGNARSAARNAGCLNVLRQYGVAFNLYAAENKNVFPSGATNPVKWFSALSSYMGATNSDEQSKAGTCPELFSRFSEYESYFGANVAKEDRRGYQYNRYLNRGSTGVPPILRSAIAHPSLTVLLWESVGVGPDSGNISGYPGGSFYYPKYRHAGKMNLLMVSGEVATRVGTQNPDEAQTDISLPAAEGGINWKKSGEPFYFQ